MSKEHLVVLYCDVKDCGDDQSEMDCNGSTMDALVDQNPDQTSRQAQSKVHQDLLENTAKKAAHTILTAYHEFFEKNWKTRKRALIWA